MGSSTQSPAASPATKAKGKSKAKADPPAKKPKGVTKQAGPKTTAKKPTRGKGRGHKKTYPDAVTQAAHERQKELLELYSQVANAVKPGLEALADHSLKELATKEDVHKEVEEYEILQAELKQLYDNNVKSIEREFDIRNGIAGREYELETDRINKCFTDSFNYHTEEFMDGALNRTSILEELRNEGCPLTTPDLTYTYVDHIPYVSCCQEESILDQAHARESARQERLAAKRKADGLPEEESEPKRPRHTGGLLASEQQLDGVSESNAPTPSANEEFEVAPVDSTDIPPFHSGTGEPDEFGVRKVKRRVKHAHNRFVVPPYFQWDDDEIGFRDSTNDFVKKVTQQDRGKFYNTPNSNAWFMDHTARSYDVRDFKDETLDPELVRKHRLHPKYGFFLAGSVNEPEPPNKLVDGTRPIVHVPDQNTTEHTSRSVKAVKMDRMLQEDGTKSRMTSLLGSFCKIEDIDQEDIVTSEMRERETQARERLAVPDEDGVPLENSDQPQHVSDNLFRECVNILLAAAEAAGEQPAAPPDPPSPRHSRPYDAVRDVFTGTQPAPARSEQYSEASTSPLNVLASAAEDVSRSGNERRSKGSQSRVDRTEMEPRGYAGHSQQLPSSNNFLATALNPTSTYMPIAPAPPHPTDVAPQAPQAPPAPPHRNPFTNGIRDSPGLPPLRPNRSECLGKSHLSPQLQPLPPPLHQPQEFVSPHGLVHTNSGTYYAPAPTRAYHQAHSYHDPPMMPMPIQSQPMSMMPNHHAPTYHPSMSPMHGQAQLAPMPQMEPPAPSVSPPGPPMLAPSPPAHGTRLRTAASSNGNGAGRQFRRIAAAPASNNRPWQTNGGTELRLAHYDHKEAIKDYRANEPPPRAGSINIRGWQQMKSVATKGRNKGARKEDSEEKDSPK